MLEKIEVLLPQVAVLKRPPTVSSPSISPERTTWITNQVNLLFGSFRKADADNAEVFSAGCIRLFAAFPEEVVAYVVDPLTGLPGKSEWLPSLRAVKAALDERHAEIVRFERLKDAEREQLAARNAAVFPINRPTLAELKAKHGPNWGLIAETAAVRSERTRALMAKANDRLLRAEYAAPGVTPREAAPGIPMSAALAHLIGNDSA